MSSNVFGLDIGTRNVVGTVGYKTEDGEFIVAAQFVKQHETRAMIDGQIHDIGRVARSVGVVKSELEKQINESLSEVCIAAAGRVLKTVTTHIEYEFPEESIVTGEDLHTLNLLGVEKAQDILREQNDTNYKFYCVGYTVVKFYLNDEVFISLEGHKANKIGEDIIVTFLPEDVVDGLYSAVGQVGLTVANMTLEPIAAINVAIPEHYRMLNIALVDVGAGTSDISVTKDGSIIAYGMIPQAGDELTEVLVQHYLVDFRMAEKMKLSSTVDKEVEYEDIMSIKHTVPAEEVWELLHPVVDRITTEISNKILELNGDQTVSACFVVGGGGKVHGFTEMLAEKLSLPQERVALRGEEVLKEVVFEQEDIKKDPLLVTPIGICLNYFDQKNNFIMVRFNGERLKLYDNNRLTIVDAALQAGFPNDQLFPKRGMPINFIVNGASRIARGEAGEPAKVLVNGVPANLNTPLEPNSDIVIEPSTAGDAAIFTIGQLEENRNAYMIFTVNGKIIKCPRYFEVNGNLEPDSYQIQEGDVIETRGFYTVAQVAEFMDIKVDLDYQILVNNREADLDTLVYENFTIDLTPENEYLSIAYESAAYRSGYDVYSDGNLYTENTQPAEEGSVEEEVSQEETVETEPVVEVAVEEVVEAEPVAEEVVESVPEEKTIEAGPVIEPVLVDSEPVQEESVAEETVEAEPTVETTPVEETKIVEEPQIATSPVPSRINKIRRLQAEDLNEEVIPSCVVTVNEETIELTGKKSYIFVDIFDKVNFDLTAGGGRAIATLINGHDAQFSEEIKNGDHIDLYWKER